MQDSNLIREKGDTPRVPAQKPAIAAKPKYVPPVNLKTQKQHRDETTQNQDTSKKHAEHGTRPFRHVPNEQSSLEKKTEVTEKFTEYTETFHQYEYLQSQLPPPPDAFKNDSYAECCLKYNECTYTEKCDKFSSFQSPNQNKTPSSPSTVCCSILSNASTDCCGIITNPNKKELNGKTMAKIDSVDSNSSDSGGFKDFIQLDFTKTVERGERKLEQNFESNQMLTHHRKISQPEFLDNSSSKRELINHQRKSSQPDFLSQDKRQSQNKQPPVANAQALAHFLPPEKSLKSMRNERVDDSNKHFSGKLNIAQASQMFLEKTEEKKFTPKPKPQLISSTQFLQSTRKLEELLSQRYDSDKVARKGQSCLLDGELCEDVEQKMNVQKQIQQKLQADLKQTVKHIQEIQSIDLRLPQNRKWSEVGDFYNVLYYLNTIDFLFTKIRLFFCLL